MNVSTSIVLPAKRRLFQSCASQPFLGSSRRSDVHERLYKEHVLRTQKRVNDIEQDQIFKEAELRQFSFQPDLSLTSNFHESISLIDR